MGKPTLESLLSEIAEYQQTIELPINEVELEKDLINAIQLNARTGKMLADAIYIQDIAIKNNIAKDIKDFVQLPALTLNKFINAYCAKENYLVNWIDRVNKCSDKKAKAIITLISKQKAEMQNLKYGV